MLTCSGIVVPVSWIGKGVHESWTMATFTAAVDALFDSKVIESGIQI